MTAPETGYTLDNAWANAHRRLTLIEETYDEVTTGHLTRLGVGPGWRCPELGAGAGSIARWLADRVDDAGTVTAVDLEPRFLEAHPRPNMAICGSDIGRRRPTRGRLRPDPCPRAAGASGHT
jgi:hypothetical protein